MAREASGRRNIITHEEFEANREQYSDLSGPHGSLLFVACDSGTDLAKNVRDEYHSALAEKYGGDRNKVVEIPLMTGITQKFEENGHDGTCPRLPKHVGGADAYVFSNVMDKGKNSSTVNDNLKQLEQMVYTLKAHGVSKVTAVTPYFPYSRQDKPSFMQREATLAKAVVDGLVAHGLDRLVCYHPHSTGLRAFSPVDKHISFVSGLDLFVRIFSNMKKDKEAIAFCTDPGGIKEAIHLANALGINYGLGAKHRPEPGKSESLGAQANLDGKKRVIITDDESATFSSCFDLMEYLSKDHGIREFHVGISHMRLQEEYIPKLVEAHERFGLRKLHITDSVPQKDRLYKLPFIEVHPLARTLALVINSHHYDMSVSKLFYAPEK